MVTLRIEQVLDAAALQPRVDQWLPALCGTTTAVLFSAGLPPPDVPPGMLKIALAPGCPCCIGAFDFRARTLIGLLSLSGEVSALLLLSGGDHAEVLRERIRSGKLGSQVRLIGSPDQNPSSIQHSTGVS
jgi:hydrogenase maturation factor